MSPQQGRQPVAAPAAAVVGVLLALMLIAAGAIAIRDTVLAAGSSGPRWVTNTATAIDGLAPATWMIPAGVIAVLVGLWWLLAALKPRRRTEVPLRSAAGVWIRPAGIARMSRATADSVAGTTSARAAAGRRRVKVTVSASDKEAAELRSRVAEAVAERIDPVQRRYAVKVKVKSTPDGGA